ncbi:MAG: glutamate--tRNA ligase [Acidobacteria bacterium]|nr:glutamate--tRNA ligase [Acidobacteriota bacterium]
MADEVRVRFAPSPTGELHVGGARTALYNWLYAKNLGGKFILRVEDTDEKRSTEENLETILRSMQWLGLDWDEGPVLQSDRLDLYNDYVSLLMSSGNAYYCFAAQEDIEEQRREALEADENWVYRGADRELSSDEVRAKLDAEEPHTVRFKVPDEGTITVDDAVQGEVTFESAHIEDFVLQRSDEKPTYHLSNVVDDIEMGITHVIRGADHLSNTPKQVLVYEALNAKLPIFAHLPLILGEDGKRLSKRHGATSVEHFHDKGYLPGAVINYLALLGWNAGDDREVFTSAELTSEFSLERVNKANPKFDVEKLSWLNGEYIKEVPAGELRPAVREALQVRGCWNEELDMERRDFFFALIELWQPRSRTINELADHIAPFLTEAFAYEPDGLKEHVHGKDLLGVVQAFREALLQVDPWNQEQLEESLREVATGAEKEAAELIHPTRIALVGKKASPGIFEVLELMGREKARVRLDRMIRYLSKLEEAKTKRLEQIAAAAAKK